MSGTAAGARLALVAGLALGVLGDLLLRTPRPGLNVLLWVGALVVSAVVAHRRVSGGPGTEARVLLATAVVLTAFVAWRASPALNVLAVGGACAVLALPAWRAGAGWIGDATIVAHIRAVAGTAIGVLKAPLLLAEADVAEWRGSGVPARRWGTAAAAGLGVVLAMPFLAVFGALFVSADAAFERLVADMFRLDVEEAFSHIALIFLLAWLTAGWLRTFLGVAQPEAPAAAEVRPRLGITETAVAIALINMLFLLFVAVQFRHLFGGVGVVELTPGLTYAEHARRGFFELVAAVALVLPLLVGADALLRRERPHDDRIFRALAGVQVALVLVIAASALGRMHLYQQAYGLTEARVYATAALLSAMLVLAWFAGSVLRNRREAFAAGTLAIALATITVLHVLDPDALIARTNIARAAQGAPLDVTYTASLGADAVPVLVAALSALPPDARCRTARRLLRNWPPDARPPLRAWNLGDARARAAVRAAADRLRAAAGSGDACVPTASGPA